VRPWQRAYTRSLTTLMCISSLEDVLAAYRRRELDLADSKGTEGTDAIRWFRRSDVGIMLERREGLRLYERSRTNGGVFGGRGQGKDKPNSSSPKLFGLDDARVSSGEGIGDDRL